MLSITKLREQIVRPLLPPRKITQLKTGVVHDECSGSMVVPSDGGLVKGQSYYARVFAYSPIGFSQGQVGLLVVWYLVHDWVLPVIFSGSKLTASLLPSNIRLNLANQSVRRPNS